MALFSLTEEPELEVDCSEFQAYLGGQTRPDSSIAQAAAVMRTYYQQNKIVMFQEKFIYNQMKDIKFKFISEA